MVKMPDKELSPEEILEGIRKMTIRGAAEIGRKASLALRLYAEREFDSDRERYLGKLKEFRKRALKTRPTAITLWNGVTKTLAGTESAESSDEMLEIVKRNSEEVIKWSHEAIKTISAIGARRIPKNAVILTHCNSSAAIAAIIEAHAQRKIEMVYATESRPKRQGYITVKQLAERNVPVTIIVDSAVRHHMKLVDMVLVGADTIASNGAVINKIGTSQIALIAHERKVPFIVCAETYKFSPKTFHGVLVPIEERAPSEIIDPEEFPGVEISNPVFDSTPPQYIDSIITELGIIPPSAAYEIVVHNYGLEMLRDFDAIDFEIGDGE